MTGPVTDVELAALPAKTKRHSEVVQLYRAHDFRTAYAMHTDWRIAEHGYRNAIGDAKDWDRHGDLQAQFLIGEGLTPPDTLLDIGCGTGRLARKLAPYLLPGGYYGVDLSDAAVACARALSVEEGWAKRLPRLATRWPSGRTFSFLWAFSVTIHLPVEMLVELMRNAAAMMDERSRFYFSYVPEARDERTGFKQFRHTIETIIASTTAAGLTFEPVTSWTGEQRIALARRA